MKQTNTANKKPYGAMAQVPLLVDARGLDGCGAQEGVLALKGLKPADVSSSCGGFQQSGVRGHTAG